MADKTRIGILSFAHMHANAYASAFSRMEGVELVGVADDDTVRGAAKAAEFGARYYPSVESLLAEGLAGVVIASENVYHRLLTEQSADAGVKAILCEKPLATTVDDGYAMIERCALRGVKLATAFPCRFSPPFIEALKAVRQGTIGDVLAIRGTNRGRNPGGWFVQKELSGGGAVIDHTVHVADLNRLVLGREAVEVYAETGSGFAKGDYDDTGFLTISYEGGVFATLDTTWSRPKTWPTWGDVGMQIVGTQGVIDLELFAQTLGHYDDQGGAIHWPGWGSNFDALMIADFVKLCSGDTDTQLATGEDGLRALEVALAAYRSADAGQPVAV